MSGFPRLVAEDYRPQPPPDDVRRRYGIGIVGCGGIARGAHLPAYKTFDYGVVAACDVIEANARHAAEQFAIPYWASLRSIRRRASLIDLVERRRLRGWDRDHLANKTERHNLPGQRACRAGWTSRTEPNEERTTAWSLVAVG